MQKEEERSSRDEKWTYVNDQRFGFFFHLLSFFDNWLESSCSREGKSSIHLCCLIYYDFSPRLLKIFRGEVCVNTLIVVSIASRKSISYLGNTYLLSDILASYIVVTARKQQQQGFKQFLSRSCAPRSEREEKKWSVLISIEMLEVKSIQFTIKWFLSPLVNIVRSNMSGSYRCYCCSSRWR